MSFTKPTVNGSSGVWGTMLNQALDDLDTRTTAAQSTATTANTGVNTLSGRMTTAESNIQTLQNAGSGTANAVPLATVTAKGDLIVGTANGAVSRLGVTNARVLASDSTTGTGLSWVLPGTAAVATSTTRPAAVAGARVYETDTNRFVHGVNVAGNPTYVPPAGSILLKARQTAAQTINSAADVLATFDTVDYDRLGGFSGGSGYTPALAGWYEFTAAVTFVYNSSFTGGLRSAYWMLNGVLAPGGGTSQNGVTGGTTVVHARAWTVLLTTTQTVSLQIGQTSGTALTTGSATAWAQCAMSAKYLGNA